MSSFLVPSSPTTHSSSGYADPLHQWEGRDYGRPHRDKDGPGLPVRRVQRRLRRQRLCSHEGERRWLLCVCVCGRTQNVPWCQWFEECVCARVCHLQAKLAEFKAAGFDVDLEFLDAALIALQGKTFTSLLHLTAFSFFLSSVLSWSSVSTFSSSPCCVVWLSCFPFCFM